MIEVEIMVQFIQLQSWSTPMDEDLSLTLCGSWGWFSRKQKYLLVLTTILVHNFVFNLECEKDGS